jgi:hypothetical protein
MSLLPINGSSAGTPPAQPLGIELAHVTLGQRAILTIARPLRLSKLRRKHQERAEHHAHQKDRLTYNNYFLRWQDQLFAEVRIGPPSFFHVSEMHYIAILAITRT